MYITAPVARPAVPQRSTEIDPVQTAAQARHIQRLLLKAGVSISASEGVRLAKVKAGALRPDDQATIVLLARLHRLEQAEAGITVGISEAIATITKQFPNTPAILTSPPESAPQVAHAAPSTTQPTKTIAADKQTVPAPPRKRGDFERGATPFQRWKNQHFPQRQ